MNMTERAAADRLRNFALFYAKEAAPYAERTTAAFLLAIAALDKQTPKRPAPRRKAYSRAWTCPACGMIHGEKERYCSCCGQRIDWEGKLNE